MKSVLTFAGHAILAGVLGENSLTRSTRIGGDGSGAYLAMDMGSNYEKVRAEIN